jgi:enterochelin esterase-like enzyme
MIKFKNSLPFILWLFTSALVILWGSACASQQSSPVLEPDRQTPEITNAVTPIPPLPSLQRLTNLTSTIISSEANPSSPTTTPTNKPAANITPTTMTCWQENGTIQELSLRTDLLPLPMEYYIYLPACYNELPSVSFPTLYLIHGQNYNHDQWSRLGVFESADRMIRGGEIPPMIIVLPRDRDWRQPTEDNFGVVLAEELIPWVDKNYRTIQDRQFRAIGGLSRGAGWAVHLGLNYWDIFGAIGGHSLPIFWTDTQHIRKWLDDIPNPKLPKIYLDIGKNDREQILKSATWFENLLTEKNIPHEWYLNPGYHEESYWQSHLEEYLLWYTGNWWVMYGN